MLVKWLRLKNNIIYYNKNCRQIIFSIFKATIHKYRLCTAVYKVELFFISVEHKTLRAKPRCNRMWKFYFPKFTFC